MTAIDNSRKASARTAAYRERKRAAGLRPVQLWLPDTRDPAFIAKCREISLAIARHDPAGKEADRFIEATYEWPDE